MRAARLQGDNRLFRHHTLDSFLKSIDILSFSLSMGLGQYTEYI